MISKQKAAFEPAPENSKHAGRELLSLRFRDQYRFPG
jgi:hypothetical protein